MSVLWNHNVSVAVRNCLAALGCVLIAAGCERSPSGDSAGARGAKPGVLRLATTTSTENSGLLDHLLPVFQQRTGIRVHVLSMGTGKALQTARRGDCDVVLVHAPAAEKAFVEEGYGVSRRAVMYNDFVILGPPADPASVRGSTDASEALRRIAHARAAFVSRDDESGTHKKEKALWGAAGVRPEGGWYLRVGQGMGASLTIANQKLAYILADRGTFLAFAGKIGLELVFEGGEELRNPYSVIAANPERFGHLNHQAATKFIDFLTSAEGRRRIAEYRVNGQPLFHVYGSATAGQPGGN